MGNKVVNTEWFLLSDRKGHLNTLQHLFIFERLGADRSGEIEIGEKEEERYNVVIFRGYHFPYLS